MDNTQPPVRKVGSGVGVMLFRNGKVLFGKRHIDPQKAASVLHGEGTWTMVGGKLHFQESFEECARREVMEETGIKLNNFKVICVNNDMVEDAHFTTIGIFCDDFEGEPQVREPDQITEWKWFDIDALPSPLYFPSAKIIHNYTQQKFYIENNKP